MIWLIAGFLKKSSLISLKKSEKACRGGGVYVYNEEIQNDFDMAERQFVTFYLGSDLYGIDIILVREVYPNFDVTVVDDAPRCIRGLLNLRGQIVTVIDLGVRLDLGERKIFPTSSCIVLKTASEIDEAFASSTTTELVGLLVDKIGDVVSVDSKAIAPPPAHTAGVQGKFLEGVVKMDDRLLILLKSSEILSVKDIN